MMEPYLGFDTSNYTTSAALFDKLAGTVEQKKMPLPVKPGELGLRQADAVFHHTRQLPRVVEELFAALPCAPLAVGASVRPRGVEGSYMPCFTVGEGAARTLAAALRVPFCAFSHQQGHVAAALYSCGRLDLLHTPFLAFHASGGTTDALSVTPGGEEGIQVAQVAGSLDLKAGQAVDRVGALLDLPFPAGPALESLAAQWEGPVAARPVMKGRDCSLSGVQNQCERLQKEGREPAYIARYCLAFLEETFSAMARALFREYGPLPLVCAGGVMANSFLRARMQQDFGALFAEPAFSADNAAGVAVLTAWRMHGYE